MVILRKYCLREPFIRLTFGIGFIDWYRLSCDSFEVVWLDNDLAGSSDLAETFSNLKWVLSSTKSWVSIFSMDPELLLLLILLCSREVQGGGWSRVARKALQGSFIMFFIRNIRAKLMKKLMQQNRRLDSWYDADETSLRYTKSKINQHEVRQKSHCKIYASKLTCKRKQLYIWPACIRFSLALYLWHLKNSSIYRRRSGERTIWNTFCSCSNSEWKLQKFLFLHFVVNFMKKQICEPKFPLFWKFFFRFLKFAPSLILEFFGNIRGALFQLVSLGREQCSVWSHTCYKDYVTICLLAKIIL